MVNITTVTMKEHKGQNVLYTYHYNGML